VFFVVEISADVRFRVAKGSSIYYVIKEGEGVGSLMTIDDEGEGYRYMMTSSNIF